MRRIVVRLREDRRTPLHSWRLQMFRELLRILAIPARILSEPWRFLLQSWLQNATTFANVNAKKFSKNHPKMVPKTPKSIKIAKNAHRSNKIAPRTEKDAKQSQEFIFFGPPWAPKISQNRKKGVSKIDDFFDPLLEPTLPHFRLPQAPQKQPK